MKLIFCAGLGIALSAALVPPASAQWQTSAGVGARSVTHTEYDLAGRRVVRERGWLPGVALGAAWRSGDLTWTAGIDGYRGDIDYRGQTQGGVRADSATSTTLASMQVGAAYALGRDVSALAALELDWWKRTIRPAGGSAGLRESYRSWRLVAGAAKDWRPAPGLVRADVALVLSEPERMRVDFSGMFDTASFDTRHGRGLRLGVSLNPAFARQLVFSARYDWMRIPRSADTPLTARGELWGMVAQPEHRRQSLTLAASAVF